MKSLDKSEAQYFQNISRPSTERKNLSKRKQSPLRNQIDGMLQKDYSMWRSDKQKFNAINSVTAKNRQKIQQYVHGIYNDYNIQDPLPQKYDKTKGNIPINRQNIYFQPVMRQFQSKLSESFVPHFISSRNAYMTPVKHAKKGLEVVNVSKYSQISVSKSNQKLQFTPSPNKLPQSYQSKVKFVQRTAPSLHSSFLLTNSKNQGLSQPQINRNILNTNYDDGLYQSRLSIVSRLPKQSYQQFQTSPYKQLQPSLYELKSYQEVSPAQKKYPEFLTEQKVYPTFGSQESFGKINPEIEIKDFENKIYAKKLFEDIGKINRIGFDVGSGKIKQSFRYCVGCENAVLEANISFHQNQCLQFKKILNLSTVTQITKEVDKKIDKILGKISEKTQQVNEKDPEKIKSSSRILIQQVEQFKQNKIDQQLNHLSSESFNLQYDKIMQIGKNWGQLTEQINKLKWFLVIKDNFLKLQISQK